jgi:hypothetical protein
LHPHPFMPCPVLHVRMHGPSHRVNSPVAGTELYGNLTPNWRSGILVRINAARAALYYSGMNYEYDDFTDA